MPKHPEITIKITQPIDNTRLILRCLDAFWKYEIQAEAEHVALRHVYKHLSLAYLNPEVVNHILSNQCHISVRDMLDKASRSNDFAEQKKLFDFQQHL